MPAFAGHTTGRDTLASYGSHCSAAYGFARSTGFLPSLVDPGFGLNNAVPSVQLHYRAFIPTTDRPAPVPCIGTLILAGTACLDFSLNIRATGSRVPHRSLDQSHAAFMPDAAWAEIRPSPRLVPGYRIPPGFDIILHFSTPHQRFACARLSKPYLTGQAPPFPQRSPPRLFTVATCGGLKPTPDGRLRGACPHLLCSSAPPLLLVLSRHTLVEMPSRVRLQATLSQVGRDHRSEMVHPTPNCLIRNRHSALRQQILDVAQAEREPEKLRTLYDHRSATVHSGRMTRVGRRPRAARPQRRIHVLSDAGRLLADGIARGADGRWAGGLSKPHSGRAREVVAGGQATLELAGGQPRIRGGDAGLRPGSAEARGRLPD